MDSIFKNLEKEMENYFPSDRDVYSIKSRPKIEPKIKSQVTELTAKGWSKGRIAQELGITVYDVMIIQK